MLALPLAYDAGPSLEMTPSPARPVCQRMSSTQARTGMPVPLLLPHPPILEYVGDAVTHTCERALMMPH